MYKKSNIPRTTHPEFLTVEEQLVSSKLLPTSSLYKSRSQPLLFESRPRVQPVANTMWTRSIRNRNRRMNEFPSLKKYKRKQPSTFGVVGHHEGSEVDILERQHRHRPGPASYEPKQLPSKGGKFNLSKAKSDLEWKIYFASKTPGPADFDPQPLKRKGGKFSNAVPKSDVEWLIYHASMKPGVGEYDMAKAYKNLTGPGPCARISSIERGLQRKSNFQPKIMERSIKGKDIVVLKEEHKRRKKKKPLARGIRAPSPEKVTKAASKNGLAVMKSKNKGDIVYVQKQDKLGRVRVAAVKVPRF